MEDYYQILGVPEDASEEQIKKRFRELAKIYHPDRGGDPEKFKQILKAYTTLSNKKSREEYDFWRKRWQTTFSYDFRNYDFKYQTSDYTSKSNEYSQKENSYSKQERSDSSIKTILVIVYFIFVLWLATIYPIFFFAIFATNIVEKGYDKAKEIFYKLKNDKAKWEKIKKILTSIFENILGIGFLIFLIWLNPIMLFVFILLGGVKVIIYILDKLDKYKKK